MAALFVSHSSHDRAAAERICARLRAAGFAALFVDFDPEHGIPAGRNWERELYAQLRNSGQPRAPTGCCLSAAGPVWNPVVTDRGGGMSGSQRFDAFVSY